MPTNIAPDLSVYGLVERIQQHSTILNHRRTMSVISYEIENATLLDGTQTRIFSAFQKLSRFLPQVKRYRQLAQTAESIYVFGIPDITPPQIPNIHYVYLKPTDQLAKEWFLVSYGREYASILATEELSSIDDPDDQRIFKGIWSFDVSLTAILEQWLTNSVDAPALLIQEDEHNHTQQQQLVQNILARLNQRQAREVDSKQNAVICKEVQNIIDNTVTPALA